MFKSFVPGERGRPKTTRPACKGDSYFKIPNIHVFSFFLTLIKKLTSTTCLLPFSVTSKLKSTSVDGEAYPDPWGLKPFQILAI